MRALRGLVAFIALGVLSGCGADGEPIQPSLNAGIAVSADGNVNVGGGVGFSQGPISLFFGF